jgi:HAD superfamily phosphatase (TIGR01668 family)
MEICKKKGLFYPDILFPNIYEITPEFLHAQKVKGLVLDLDNTIAPYEVIEPTDEMNKWFRAMKAAGIKLAFVSNNKGERVKIFNRTWGIPLFAGAKKPSPKGVRMAMQALKLTPDETAGLGDQIFTDCLACHRAGLRFYLVPPIKDKKTLFFRGKRMLEKPFVGKFKFYRTYLSQTESV